MVAGLCGFADAPEERRRALHDAGDVFASSLMAQPEAEWNVDYVIESLAEPTHGGLFFIG
jgi:hypothetical protein